MYLIAVYDISTIDKSGRRRLNKIMKLFRQYLNHAQKSVFEGEVTEAGFLELKIETDKLIKDEVDYVLFYRIDNKNNLKKVSLGIDYDPTSQFI